MFNTKENSLWVEKYRPDKLENYIGNTQMKEKFARFITEQDIPHLLLTGPAGTGKTTASKILVNSIECDKMIINASDENNIETVRTKIRGFASTVGFSSLKILILDEFDGFTQQGQSALRNLMEQYSDHTRFILTANYLERILPPIVSRTQHFTVVPPSRKDTAIHIIGILKAENITFKLQDVKLIIDAHFPDIRKILNELQSNVIDGELKIDQTHVIDNDVKLKIISIFNEGGSDAVKFKTIRQLVADAQVKDFTPFYRIFFDRVTEYGKSGVSLIILALAEAQFRDSMVVDKEINFMALIINILTALNS